MNIIRELNLTKYVVLPFSREQIVSSIKTGDDLLIKLSNGEVVRVEDYFSMFRHLVLNSEQGQNVQLLEVDDISGYLLNTKTLTYNEQSELFGNDLAMLSSQTSEDVLLSNGLNSSVIEDSGVVDGVTGGIFLGLGALGAGIGVATAIKHSDDDTKVDTVKGIENDASKTVIDVNNDGNPEKVIVTNIDSITGEVVTTTTEDKNDDGIIDKKTITVDKDADGIAEKITEITIEKDGTKITKVFLDTDDDGKFEDVITTTEHPDKTITTESRSAIADNNGDLVDTDFIKDDASLVISEGTLNKIANSENGHKVMVNNEKPANQSSLENDFTKTAETEGRDGEEYVKYTNDSDDMLIINPDITNSDTFIV
ncbi:hypothetical protein QJU43_06645 [Pasteurella atlantica]|uniref:BapA/Bap/LapF family prefix-like domain-containing protein n=1 Tax=Pasteurellaceae TaxID=712 RepID=UPI00276D37AB|nr:hypothetical protein [Pasteurella atlantica]MDP8033837.1 hypothetical protein [Pasteurella atlantica]MDP8035772.1 hypothetical protein [Pasteurella atlantica]MDP8037693.1 hypothetical protein [Pasteurella atlantica]MDP8048073.1 hypothetical protein [Pasteurella atlantica]MDP8050096.1 hypothetical protein [Pasteurella atlantica]